jgi:hypothetical protein
MRELTGNAARDYLEHLRLVEVNNDTWEAVYECPKTGSQWLEAYPDSGAHGGGASLLRRIDQSAAAPGTAEQAEPPFAND